MTWRGERRWLKTMREEAGVQIQTVTEITRAVRALIEGELGTVWVEGEISNHRRQASGHQYFTLKDERCQLACVLFQRPGSGFRQGSPAPLADGMQVVARGKMSVYESRGQYQLNVTQIQAAGAGLLQARFEALKRKLDAEGLFDPARKQPLPPFPQTVGIVTSPTGAALRDMLNILGRRAPWVRVVINPVKVQGEGAAAEIAAAVTEFAGAADHGLPVPDVVVLARGGGSVEDLWAFNEEIVARAVFACPIPVISAVGHEIDFTIADFVADVRAPTPSAAAEILAPEAAELRRRLRDMGAALGQRAAGRLEAERGRLAVLARGRLFAEPERRCRELWQRLDHLREGCGRLAALGVGRWRERVGKSAAAVAMHRPDQVLAARRQALLALAAALREHGGQRLERWRHRVQQLAAAVRLLSPAGTLDRGYSITTAADGTVVRGIAMVGPGMRLVTRLRDGRVLSDAVGTQGDPTG